jgi:hypothetical protein
MWSENKTDKLQLQLSIVKHHQRVTHLAEDLTGATRRDMQGVCVKRMANVNHVCCMLANASHQLLVLVIVVAILHRQLSLLLLLLLLLFLCCFV